MLIETVSIRGRLDFPTVRAKVAEAVTTSDASCFEVEMFGPTTRRHRNALARWLADSPGVSGVTRTDSGLAFTVAFDRPTVHEWRAVEDPRGGAGVELAAWADGSTPSWMFVPDAAAAPSPVTAQRPMAWVF